MNPKDYRRQVEDELRAASVPSIAAAVTAPAPRAMQDWTGDIKQLADASLDAAHRHAALQRLQAGTFLGSQFAPHRAAYIQALRSAATSNETELCHSALDILANLKDDFARQKLVEGLRGIGQALVPAAVALNLLARDDHGSAADIAREILTSGADVPTREQAARALAADPRSKDLLSERMRDKAEFREVRRASAVALRSLDPQAFLEGARDILADADEFRDIKATVHGALERAGVAVSVSPAPQ
jgi:hypothetical protein